MPSEGATDPGPQGAAADTALTAGSPQITDVRLTWPERLRTAARALVNSMSVGWVDYASAAWTPTPEFRELAQTLAEAEGAQVLAEQLVLDRAVLVERLSAIYEDDSAKSLVAQICDEALDRSGRLLGEVRDSYRSRVGAPVATDWTAGPDGRSNSSRRFLDLVERVTRIIRGDASNLIAGRTEQTARLIVAQLAHAERLAPRD